jgi:tol-pal system protein YbgF
MKSLFRKYLLVPLVLLSAFLSGPLQAEPPVVEASTSSAVTTGTDTTATGYPQYGDNPQGNMLELLNRLDQLENEIRQLRGDIEVLGHDTQGMKRRQRELYLDMDRRLRELELGAVRTKPAPVDSAPIKADSKPAVKPPVAVKVPVASAPTLEEKTAYKSAFNLLKEGRYEQSIKAFNKFLKEYPNSTYADNAQYWVGEANYVSRKYKKAVEEFDRVIVRHPGSPKIADAMLKKGFTHYELGQWDKARKTLEEVIEKFPKGTAARLAETRLQRMKKEGR